MNGHEEGGGAEYAHTHPRALTYDVVLALKHPCTLEARATFSLPPVPAKDFAVQATMNSGGSSSVSARLLLGLDCFLVLIG